MHTTLVVAAVVRVALDIAFAIVFFLFFLRFAFRLAFDRRLFVAKAVRMHARVLTLVDVRL